MTFTLRSRHSPPSHSPETHTLPSDSHEYKRCRRSGYTSGIKSSGNDDLDNTPGETRHTHACRLKSKTRTRRSEAYSSHDTWAQPRADYGARPHHYTPGRSSLPHPRRPHASARRRKRRRERRPSISPVKPVISVRLPMSGCTGQARRSRRIYLLVSVRTHMISCVYHTITPRSCTDPLIDPA